MYRQKPVSNKLLSKKWANKEQEIHKAKLREMRPTVEIREPSQFRHLQKKLKKTQMQEDRYTEIERENRILLEKMTNIMQNSNLVNKTTIYNSAAVQQPSIQPSVYMTSTTTNLFQKRSLNKEARKRELLKITMENQAILKRLQDKQPNYNVLKWEMQNMERKKILQNICEYPYLLDEQTLQSANISGQVGNLSSTAGVGGGGGGGANSGQSQYNSGPPEYIIKKKRSAMTSMPFYTKKKGYSSESQPADVRKINSEKEIYYQGEQDLGNGLYSVQIFLSTNNELVITAQHTQRNDNFVIEIQEEKVKMLVNEFNQDYALMAEHLKIMNKRMVLLNPKFVRASKTASPERERLVDTQPEPLTDDKARSFSNMDKTPLIGDNLLDDKQDQQKQDQHSNGQE